MIAAAATNDRTRSAAQCASDAPGGDAPAGAATLSVGMAVALGAVFMAFAAVLLAYAIIRVQAPGWPPSGESPPPPLWPWPALATAAALVGSAAMGWATTRNLAGRAGPRLLPPLVLAAVAGVTFMVVQSLGWRWLLQTGVRPDSGLVASVIFALTIFHAAHAGAALVFLAPLVVRVGRGGGVRRSSVAAVASFWHLVTVAWLVVLVAVFVA